MTLQQLRYVLEVATCGSMSSAAANLFVAQPSLSKAIGELEQEMGIKIFRRTFAGSTLTDDGVRFVAYARQVVEDADRLEASYKGSYGVRPSFIVAAVHNTLVSRAFGEVVRALDSAYYELAIRGGEVTDIVEGVRTNEADLGVLYRSAENAEALGALTHAMGLTYRPIASVPVFVLISTKHPCTNHDSVRLSDLEDLPCIEQRPWYGDGVHPVRRLFRLPEAARRVIVADGATRRDLIAHLNGYALAVGSLGDDPSTNGLARVRLEGFGPVDIGLLEHPDRPLSSAAREFAAALERVACSSVGAVRLS